jgi:hypothetical protein
MAQQRVPVVESEPEVLAAATHADDTSAGERVLEVGDAGDVPAYGSRMQHPDVLERRADDVSLEAATNDLDLGKLRHGSRQWALG